MIRVCCDCKKILGEIEPLTDRRKTHGFCKACAAKRKIEIDEYFKDKPEGIKERINSNQK